MKDMRQKTLSMLRQAESLEDKNKDYDLINNSSLSQGDKSNLLALIAVSDLDYLSAVYDLEKRIQTQISYNRY